MATQQKNSGRNNTNSTGKSNGKSTGSKKSGSSRSSSGSGGKSGGSGKSSGNGGSNERLTNIFLVLLLVTIVVLAILFLRKDDPEEDAELTPTPTMQLSGMPTPTLTPGGEEKDVLPTPTAEPLSTPTSSPTPTAAPTGSGTADVTGEPTVVATSTPTPVPTQAAASKPAISLEESQKVIEDAFWEVREDYRFEMAKDMFLLGDDAYYSYTVYYGGQMEDYTLLVDSATGQLYYYEDGDRIAFDGPPERGTGQEEGMTEQKAKELLSDIPASSLMLPAPLDDCTVSLDAWKSFVGGLECYCLNVFYQDTLAGIIYFTETADAVYYLDEVGEPVKVR